MAGPKPRGFIPVNISMTPQTKRLVEFAAKKQGVSLSQWVREAVLDHLTVKHPRRNT